MVDNLFDISESEDQTGDPGVQDQTENSNTEDQTEDPGAQDPAEDAGTADQTGDLSDEDQTAAAIVDSGSILEGQSSSGPFQAPILVVDQSVPESWTLDEIETFALSPIVSSSGLKGILLDVIGPYDNIITQYRYQSNTSSNYSYVHETTPDYPWIASAALFIVLIYSAFAVVRRALWSR